MKMSHVFAYMAMVGLMKLSDPGRAVLGAPTHHPPPDPPYASGIFSYPPPRAPAPQAPLTPPSPPLPPLPLLPPPVLPSCEPSVRPASAIDA